MRPLTFLFILAAASACTEGSGPTTDTTGTSTAPNPGADTSEGSAAPTSGAPEPGTTTTLDLPSTSTDPVDDTTLTTAGATTTTIDATTTTLPDDGSSTAPIDTTGPGESALVIAIVDAELYADCQPRSEPDPVQGGWTVSFDNLAGAQDTAATLVSATLSLADIDPPELEPILVSPTDSGQIPAGQQIDLPMDKLKGDKHSACDHCDEFYKLVLEYDENGTIHVAEEDVTISCSF